MTPATKYRRLPGRAGFIVRHSLWMKPDHLLRVKALLFSEEYRRYYLKDIQALVLTEKANPPAFIGYVLAASIALLTGGLFYSSHPVWGTFAGVVALTILLWSCRRPTCVCYLQTRVSTERLHALRRLRSAHKTLAILKAEIEKIQGEANREVIEAHQSQVSIPVGPDPNVRHYSGKVHWAVFVLALVRAAIGAVALAIGTYSLPLGTASGAVGAAVLLAAIVTAFQQHRTDLSQGVRWMVYAMLVWYPLTGLTGFAIQMYAVLSLGPKGSNALALLNHPLVRPYTIVTLIGYFILGCAGLALSWRRQRAAEDPPPIT
jgi:hypothetical protein